jgi:hypothetical protein
MRYLTVAGSVFLLFVVGADIALALDHHQPMPVGTTAEVGAGRLAPDPTDIPTAAPTPTPGPTDTATPSPEPTDTSMPTPQPTSSPSTPAGSPVIHVPVRPKTPVPVTHVTTKKPTRPTTTATHKVVATR